MLFKTTHGRNTHKQHSVHSIPVPRGRPSTIATFNVEGVNRLGKRQILLEYMKHKQIQLLCIQETHGTVVDSFVKDGYVFYLSGQDKDSHAGVGFIVSPQLRPHILGLKPLNSRIAVLRISASPRSIQVFSIYAPSQLPSEIGSVQAPLENEFPSTSQYFSIIMGEFNARLTSNIVQDFEDVEPPFGPCLYGKPTGPTAYTTNAEFPFDFLKS